MDGQQLKSLMLEALRPETPGGVRDPESDADKAAWWLGQALEALKEARKSALRYNCKSTASFIGEAVRLLEGGDNNAFALLELEANAEYKDRHL